MPDLVESMKRAAKEVMENSKPFALMYGRVVSESPIEISVEQKFTLGAQQLVFARGVTDYSVQVEIEWDTESAGGEASHSHGLSGKKEIKILAGLKTGERVILLRLIGGQKFLVLDRVVT